MKFPFPNKANFKVAATFVFIHVFNRWEEDKVFNVCFAGAVWLVLTALDSGSFRAEHPSTLCHVGPHLPMWCLVVTT